MRGISVVINTLNEEQNLAHALRSVQSWVDEIVVVDMHSTDRTVEIARSHGARVYLHEPLGYADPARAYAIERTTQPWILMLDADEMVPLQLSLRLLDIAREDRYDVVDIPWVNYLFGRRITHSGWGPHQDRHMRFFRRGKLHARSDIHNFLQPVPDARILKLPLREGEGVVHFNYLDVHHFVQKMNRYTDIEARRIDAGTWQFWPRALLHPPAEFIKRLVLRQGYRDGAFGWVLAGLMFFYRSLSYFKAYQTARTGDAWAIRRRYDALAQEIAREYEPR